MIGQYFILLSLFFFGGLFLLPPLSVIALFIYRRMDVLFFKQQKSCRVAFYDRLSLLTTILLAHQVYRLVGLWFRYMSGETKAINATWALSYGWANSSLSVGTNCHYAVADSPFFGFEIASDYGYQGPMSFYNQIFVLSDWAFI